MSVSKRCVMCFKKGASFWNDLQAWLCRDCKENPTREKAKPKKKKSKKKKKARGWKQPDPDENPSEWGDPQLDEEAR